MGEILPSVRLTRQALQKLCQYSLDPQAIIKLKRNSKDSKRN